MSSLHVSSHSKLEDGRKSRSFDTEELKKIVFSEALINFQKKLYDEIQKHLILFSSNGLHPSTEEQKQYSVKKTCTFYAVRSKFRNYVKEPFFPIVWVKLMDQLDKCSAVQSVIAFDMFPNSICNLGTEKQLQLYGDSLNGKILGAFCLTEISHGSDTKRMQTTATYDKATKEFVIHSPNFEAAKCWAGNLGKWATHAIVYAQLITTDKKKHGLHAFVVPVRNSKTFLPYPGVTIADLGEKIGLQGVDNGLVIFNQYRIPKKNLLNKVGDVTDDGKYVANILDIDQQYYYSFRSLSHGRLTIIVGTCMFQIHALTVGLRYVEFQKQWQIHEVWSRLYRLLPYLASTYTTVLFLNYIIIQNNAFEFDNKNLKELHAILCTAKPYFSLISRDAIQECIEVCDWLGYLSSIGATRDDNDAHLTFEGDNNVLIQQTGNWILKFWPLVISKTVIKTPLGSLDFLNEALVILELKYKPLTIEEFYEPNNICKYFQWLVCYLLKRASDKCNSLRNNSTEAHFWLKNNSQIYYLRSLSVAYLESFVLRQTYLLAESSSSVSVRSVLKKLVSLYGVWSLQKHISFFYEGQFTNNSLFSEHIEKSILLLCQDLENEAVALVDAIAPLDDIVKSVMGHSDGQVCTRLLSKLLEDPKTFVKATWLKKFNSKL